MVIPAIHNRFLVSSERPLKQQGATLIEAMVAIFVLAFGVLALMVAQLRSVSSVQEAENQTLVAQAAQTLMEGMLVNPTLEVSASGVTSRDYAAYAKGDVLTYCAAGGAASGVANTYPERTAINKSTLAQQQLCRFSSDLQNKLPNRTSLAAQVCKGNPQTGVCNAAATQYIISVSWGMQVGDATDAAQGTTNADGTMTYRYVLPVQD
ncbi:type IV pilus modification protein PilV [Paralysiella testudinis]